EDLNDEDAPQDGPELAPIPLPSSLSEEAMQDAQLSHIAKCEYDLRLGHAYDLLSAIRMSVRKTAALIADKDRNARGTKDNLRSQDNIKLVRGRSVLLASIYNCNFDTLSSLAGTLGEHDAPLSVPAHLRRIDSTKDLQMSGLTKLRNLGDSRRTLPWIFRVHGPPAANEQTHDVWEEETLRVDWFRARAAKTRTDEEINLLLAESRAHRQGLNFAASLYRQHAEALPLYQSKGATAYALEKADMYARMSRDC
ncbi:hypothetical protein C8Q76DRAFT_582249, partial [Earliella scabrosa]